MLPRDPWAILSLALLGAVALGSWALCDDEERRILAHLAIDGYISPDPSNGGTLDHLAGRGLLDPKTLTIRNDERATFIHSHVTSGDLRRWHAAETALLWNAVRLPLLASLGFLLWLLRRVRSELAIVAGALAPSLGGGLPRLMRALAALPLGKRSVG